MVRCLEHDDVAHLSLEEWGDFLRASIVQPQNDGIRLPGFPDEATQTQFVGSAFDAALNEGLSFYRLVSAATADKRYAACKAHRYLDFGCGWGRISRFFLRDFQRGDMAGVDIDSAMVRFCAEAEIPGHFLQIHNGRPLPFASGSFRLVTAYSVFTHLPEHLFTAWMGEVLRVLADGGLLVFTVEPPRFLDFIESANAEDAQNDWHRALAGFVPEVGRLRAELEQRGLAFLPTGGGDCRTPDVYGETIVTERYVTDAVKPDGKVTQVVDEPSLFWQAVYVVQKTKKSWLS